MRMISVEIDQYLLGRWFHCASLFWIGEDSGEVDGTMAADDQVTSPIRRLAPMY